MESSNLIRAMWLLNHTTLRKFEIEQLNNNSINQIFLPKSYPYDEGNLSASVTYDYDQTLDIPVNDLKILNSQNWYENPSLEAWDIANKYFKIIFIGFFPQQISSAVKNFKGIIVLRVFGLASDYSYSQILSEISEPNLIPAIKKCGSRFWFGIGYQHLKEVEDYFLSSRSVFLPVGLKFKDVSENWTGKDKSILFICPRINTSPYFKNIYENFKKDFQGFDFKIGGAQPILVDEKNVLGYIPQQKYENLMTDSRVMFYHSTEKNHIHYHPFEAIARGIPLVYMAGGMLDLLGGSNLPGRCENITQARKKIKKIMNDDLNLINSIKQSQKILLDHISSDNLVKPWADAINKIITDTNRSLSFKSENPIKSKSQKIAIIVPIKYKGGSLRGAKLLASAFLDGINKSQKNIEIVFCYLDDPSFYPEHEFNDLESKIRRRPFSWKQLDASEAKRAMHYAGQDNWQPQSDTYCIPDDGISQLQDCDLWLIISDRLDLPLLPIKPYVLMVYDYLQRYIPILSKEQDNKFLYAARHATEVWVTTNFTQQDALQYAGVEPKKIKKLPMLAPNFSKNLGTKKPSNYFIWTTNLAPHKNHRNAIEALDIYYSQLGGNLKCVVTGVESEKIPMQKEIAKGCKDYLDKLIPYIKWQGEMTDQEYQNQLSSAAFLWHPAYVDNGTFSVIEAASLGVPSLSSDYPAMREINVQFKLNLSWMNANSPYDMAIQLKKMEETINQLREYLPSMKELQNQSVENLSKHYWKALRNVL